MQDELGTPALAFTRGVCEVLGLDDTVSEEVAILRRNLLRLLQTREFGDAAAFKVGLPRQHALTQKCHPGDLSPLHSPLGGSHKSCVLLFGTHLACS